MTKRVPLTPEIAAILDCQRQAFRAKFGRDPGPCDPVFFDPEADVPRPYPEDTFRKHMLDAMERANVPPALIYAHLKTGLLISAANLHLFTPQELEAWNTAVNDFEDALGRCPS